MRVEVLLLFILIGWDLCNAQLREIGPQRRQAFQGGIQGPQQNRNALLGARLPTTNRETVNAPNSPPGRVPNIPGAQEPRVAGRVQGAWPDRRPDQQREQGGAFLGRGGRGGDREKNPRPKAISKEERMNKFRSVPANNLRQATRGGVVKNVVEVLRQSNDVQELGEGFRFADAERAEALKKTTKRTSDSDVVAYKAIAQFVLQTGNVEKIADVVMQAVTPEDGVFPSGVDPNGLKTNIQGVLSDTELMERIVAANPTNEFIPNFAHRGLKCNACTPANSFVCAHCWPSDGCGEFWWCQS